MELDPVGSHILVRAQTGVQQARRGDCRQREHELKFTHAGLLSLLVFLNAVSGWVMAMSATRRRATRVPPAIMSSARRAASNRFHHILGLDSRSL